MARRKWRRGAGGRLRLEAGPALRDSSSCAWSGVSCGGKFAGSRPAVCLNIAGPHVPVGIGLHSCTESALRDGSPGWTIMGQNNINLNLLRMQTCDLCLHAPPNGALLSKPSYSCIFSVIALGGGRQGKAKPYEHDGRRHIKKKAKKDRQFFFFLAVGGASDISTKRKAMRSIPMLRAASACHVR